MYKWNLCNWFINKTFIQPNYTQFSTWPSKLYEPKSSYWLSWMENRVESLTNTALLLLCKQKETLKPLQINQYKYFIAFAALFFLLLIEAMNQHKAIYLYGT